MDSDISIAQKVRLSPITEVAGQLGVPGEHLIPFGNYKAKLSVRLLEKLAGENDGRLVLVTSMTPTPAGEGKTTTTVGLAQALRWTGKKAIPCIREPSLGPVFGIKGGAAGGGYSQVLPMEDINLFFTGDIPAVTAANNLLSALIDNHIFQGNKLNIDPTKVIWNRVCDMNDRSLRRIFIGLADQTGIAREDQFDITAASQVMAVLCLSESFNDLRERLGDMVVAVTFFGKPVTVRDLKAHGAMAALLRDAFNPNLVQTVEGGPALVHGGPFANIAHGCNSVVATKLGLKLADIVVTEAGFGADLGAEKFFNIKCRQANLKPDAVVLVATIRALKHHGGAKDCAVEDLKALEWGWPNIEKQIENVQKFGVPLVVALNVFSTDTEAEIDFVLRHCRERGVDAALSNVHSAGGEGGLELAGKVIEAFGKNSSFKYLYDVGDTIQEKIEKIAVEIYGADGVEYTESAQHDIQMLKEQGFSNLPVCMSKTQKSLSDNPGLLGRPTGFNITVRKVRVSAGARFLIALTGDVLTMPGLPEKPAAENIDLDDEGIISGLF
jgi:formate--tetrahydrofolate ligase